MVKQTIGKGFFPFCVLILSLNLLAACSAAPQAVSSRYTDADAPSLSDTDHESCVRSCNTDYDRCGDTNAAQTPVGRDGQLGDVLGAKAGCSASLKSCLERCRGR